MTGHDARRFGTSLPGDHHHTMTPTLMPKSIHGAIRLLSSRPPISPQSSHCVPSKGPMDENVRAITLARENIICSELPRWLDEHAPASAKLETLFERVRSLCQKDEGTSHASSPLGSRAPWCPIIMKRIFSKAEEDKAHISILISGPTGQDQLVVHVADEEEARQIEGVSEHACPPVPWQCFGQECLSDLVLNKRTSCRTRTLPSSLASYAPCA